MPQTIPLNVVDLTEEVNLTVASASGSSIDMDMEQVRVVYNDLPAYTGSYIVTPTETSQTLATTNKRMTSALTVQAIPTSYGLVTAHEGYLEIT